MNSHDIRCGHCGAATAYDRGCPECRAPDPTPEEEATLLPYEIAAFRKRLGLTQARLAELLPAPRRTVEDWESRRAEGRIPPYLRRALRDLERELAAPTP